MKTPRQSKSNSETNKRVSIVIPAHNEETYLPKVLAAIGNQTSRPHQVLVVDNNSTDRTAQIAASFPFVTVLRESNQGIVFARNTGFRAAVDGGCDVIARIDADTLLPRYWIEKVQDFYGTPVTSTTALTGGCYFYNLHSGVLVAYVYDFIIHRLNRMLLGYAFPWGSNMALPVALWRLAEPTVCHTNDVHEDLDLGIHIHQVGGKTLYEPRLRVGAVARRIRSNRGQLWHYLKMWVWTLRCHRVVTWPLAIPLAVGIWSGSYTVLCLEWLVDRWSSPPTL